MPQIRILENDLINKIAAGEIIERPANILKELVENSMDAKSSNIHVKLEEGGKKLIQVCDDGYGIQKEDAHLAVCRHATSKIQGVEDLFNINSMGFRGEALASISSVSRFSLISCYKDKNEGFKLTTHPKNEKILISSWKHNKGTTLSVEDLFYNTPARLKFLKSSQSELAHCMEYIQALSLARPYHGLSLTHNNKERLRAYPSEPHQSTSDNFPFFGETLLKARTEAVLGSKFAAEKHLYVREKNEFFSFEGIISPPGFEKATTKSMFYFVNGRWVKDQVIRYGILRGYHSHLQKNNYPSIISHIRIDPSLVDVNVHPSKTEVRFQYQNEIQALISTAIRKRLRKADWASPANNETMYSSPENKNEIFDLNESYQKTDENLSLINKTPQTNANYKNTFKASDENFYKTKDTQNIFSKNISNTNQITKTNILDLPTPSDTTADLHINWNEANYLGTFKKCYILFEYHDHLITIDQHAFHERILYEELSKDQKLLKTQEKLLIAESIQLLPTQIQTMKNHIKHIKSLGFHIKFISNDTFEIIKVPSLLKRANLQKLFEELSEKTFTNKTIEEIAHLTLATIACHSAVRSGIELSSEQLKVLLEQAQNVDFYHNCPHGRRVLTFFSHKQIKKWFDRT